MSSKPLAIELFAGMFGWGEGLVAEGWRVIGFDILHEDYHGPVPEGCQLVLQDVRTLHGAQFKDADLIVASPPCQEFSYRAMPWKRAKALGPPVLGLELFWQCWRIQHEACEAAGRHIPMIVENVRGANAWTHKSVYNFGSFHLWGDVPALMPKPLGRNAKVSGMNWSNFGKPDYKAVAFNDEAIRQMGRKVPGFNFHQHEKGGNGGSFQSAAVEGLKLKDQDGYKRTHPQAFGWNAPRTSSKSSRRKAASAQIAKIPEALSRHIARVFKPTVEAAA